MLLRGLVNLPTVLSPIFAKCFGTMPAPNSRFQNSSSCRAAPWQVVRRVMRLEEAAPFRAPVDPVALDIADYFDVVDKPMDLGTIRRRLAAGGHYASAAEVRADVDLVWANCRRYNLPGDPILRLLDATEASFDRTWDAAGLRRPLPEVQRGGDDSASGRAEAAPMSSAAAEENQELVSTSKKHKVERGKGEEAPTLVAEIIS
eukprot:SM000062S19896  [mRNA]  locus=s62:202418:203218:+ [translate_table: standard]